MSSLSSSKCAACCERCSRPEILVCQHVIPNKHSAPDKAFRFEPWVFRYHLCRYHLAAENNPKNRRKVGGKKQVRLVWKTDSEVIAEWNRDQKPNGALAKNGGWQKLNVESIHEEG